MEFNIKSSQQLIKESNLKLVFSIINEREPISRADIKKITGLSATTVSSLVEELINNKFIIEVGVKKVYTSGRKAILLNVNKDGGVIAGVSVFKKAVSLNIYDLKFNVLISETVKYKDDCPLGETIVSLIKKTTEKLKIKKKLLGIAIGVPAVIDGGKIISSTILNIVDEDVLSHVKARFKNAYVALCNNSSLHAYAEKEFGNFSAKSLVSIDISDGVGAGIVNEKNIYSGARGMAGEFGHIGVNYKGEKCMCGSRGCLESYASVPAIIQKSEKILGKTDITLAHVKDEAEKGNNEILQLLDETADILSFGINSLINIIDPEIIVIGGDIKELGKDFLNLVRKYVDEKALAVLGKRIPIKYSSIEGNAANLGGAKYAFDSIFIK